MPTRNNLPLLLGVLVLTGCVTDGGFDGEPPGASGEDAASSSDGGVGETGTAASDATSPVDDATAPSSGFDSGAVESGPVEASGTGVGDDSSTDALSASDANVETGRLIGITAAHNAVRAMVATQPALPPLTWSQTLADYAQQWATHLATDSCANPQHRSGTDLSMMDYGENLATFGGRGTAGPVSTAKQAVDAWAGEVACWTYGTLSGGGFTGTEKCDMACYTQMNSDGCGHYTQIVWRKSTQLGCGVATCQNGQLSEDIWICNYAPAGNIISQAPY